MKVLSVFGTRPEAIKFAPVINALRANSSRFASVVCVTGQHREMLDSVLRLFEITPEHDLNLMKKDQSLFDVTVTGLSRVREVLNLEKPELVLVQGDTTTTFVASLAAFYLRIPVAHIEAGLRTNNKYQPFPEEINRRLTTQIADLHFPPTETAKNNLLSEGVDGRKIVVTGNTVIDALLDVVRRQANAQAQERWKNYFSQFGLTLSADRRLILVTGHRRENFGSGFDAICNALGDLARSKRNVDIIYPVHLNPNVQEPVKRILSNLPNVYLIPPLDYEPFVFLMSKSYMILTDSGGVQEEAPSLGKPVLVMRDTTERPEGVAAGTVELVGADRGRIVAKATALLGDEQLYRKMSSAHNPYGDGKASERILAGILNAARI